jgi:hypothetical protein
MNAIDLVETGKKLLVGTPSDADCRKTVSAAYYALFYQLCEMASRSLTGVDDDRLFRARYQVFRSLSHRNAYDRCRDVKNPELNFPKPVQKFADVFIELQEQRELADYCCECKYTKADANGCLVQAEEALNELDSVGIEHKKAFSLFVLLAPNKYSKKNRVLTSRASK